MKTIQTDVAVIGAGTAGLAAYRAAVASGARALLIEGGPYGTTCARVGCMPSKLLIAAAEASHAAQDTSPFGVHVDGTVRVDGREVMDRVRGERDRFVGFVVDGVEKIPQTDRLRGQARFMGETWLRVDLQTAVRRAGEGGAQEDSTGVSEAVHPEDDYVDVQARAVVIATGSSPSVPAPFKALGDRLIVNDDVFAWVTLPRRVAVFGPGVIGLELGQALSRLGVDIRVFGAGGGIGGISDPMLADEARRIFGAQFYLDTDAKVDRIERDGDEVVIAYIDREGQPRTERFDYLLAATGRRPNLAGLDLAQTSLTLDARGVPAFDRLTLQCGTAPIFIAGDANADVPLLHEAADEGSIAGRNAARYPVVQAGARRAGLAVVFSDPQIALIGPSYAQISTEDFVIGAVDFSDQGRARVMRKNVGRLHVYADRLSGRFLGAQMIGPAAEHIAHLLAWSLQQGMTIAQMLEMPFYHPVIEEGLRTALRDAEAARARDRRQAA